MPIPVLRGPSPRPRSTVQAWVSKQADEDRAGSRSRRPGIQRSLVRHPIIAQLQHTGIHAAGFSGSLARQPARLNGSPVKPGMTARVGEAVRGGRFARLYIRQALVIPASHPTPRSPSSRTQRSGDPGSMQQGFRESRAATASAEWVPGQAGDDAEGGVRALHGWSGALLGLAILKPLSPPASQAHPPRRAAPPKRKRGLRLPPGPVRIGMAGISRRRPRACPWRGPLRFRS